MFARCYGLATDRPALLQRLRPAPGPEGAYAAVIPKWAAALLTGETVFINGDGETSRDFCYVANVVQANLLAATTADAAARQPGLQRRRRRPHHAQHAVRAAARRAGRPRRQL